MTDIIDFAWQLADEHAASAIAAARQPIARGEPGDCENCGEYMPRLVDGQCGFCRDGRLPPPGWVPPVARPLTQEEPIVANGKSVMIPAASQAAIDMVEKHASENAISLGLATAQLVERGAATTPQAESRGALDLATIDADVLLDQLRARLVEVDGAAELRRENAALSAQLKASNAKLAQLRAALAD
jgi:hypothetical protein